MRALQYYGDGESLAPVLFVVSSGNRSGIGMTVSELIDRLSQFDRRLPVKALWDDCLWDVDRIELFHGRIVLDVSDGNEFEYLLKREREHRLRPSEIE